MQPSIVKRSASGLVLSLLAGASVLSPLHGQDRLRTMPGYDQFTRMSPQMNGAVIPGSVLGGGGRGGGGRGAVPADDNGLVWAPDGSGFDYSSSGRRMHFDLASRRSTEAAVQPAPVNNAAGGGRAGGRGGRGGRGGPPVAGDSAAAGRGRGSAAPARGRQASATASSDGLHLAFYRDRNLFMSDANGGNEVAITRDGSEKDRIKYGTASWVYGEELGQSTAMWWNPQGTKIAYYRFDESKVPDFYIATTQTQLQTTLDVEAYPKPGVPNPMVELFVYDVASKSSVKVDVRDGKPFSNDVVGHYVYNVRWSPDGSELFFNRMNRRQNIVEFTACAPATGKCRVVIREEWPTGWVRSRPFIQFLADSNRFIWGSERSGWQNYYLYDLTGKLLNPITRNDGFESAAILRVDEKAGEMWYMARDGDNYMKEQLHRVGLDGRNDRRLTDPVLNHQVSIAPDGKTFVDVAQSHDQAPVSRLVDATAGRVVTELAKTDLTKFDQLGLKKTELFSYLAADGKTKLYGTIAFPSNFDPRKKYPTLVPVYGGPGSGSNAPTEAFRAGVANAEYGFLIVNLDSRSVPGKGKRTLDASYLKLGVTEMDDMAEGLKSLATRPYFDKNRVGIYGTSYGGYTSAMMILRHPEVIAAASSSSPPTDWRNYDTIYTERYMWIPEENKEGYDKGSAMNYVKNLRGRLMLYYGTQDNNVHNTNMMQLIRALQQAGKSFEVQVGPDAGHSGINGQRMMEFFIENLVMNPARIQAVP